MSYLVLARKWRPQTFRDLVVQNEGGVLYAQRTEQGVTYVHYDCE